MGKSNSTHPLEFSKASHEADQPLTGSPGPGSESQHYRCHSTLGSHQSWIAGFTLGLGRPLAVFLWSSSIHSLWEHSPHSIKHINLSQHIWRWEAMALSLSPECLAPSKVPRPKERRGNTKNSASFQCSASAGRSNPQKADCWHPGALPAAQL